MWIWDFKAYFCRSLGGRAVASLLGSVLGLPIRLVGVVRSFTE